MPTGVSLFVWLPEERAKWVEMRAKRDRAIRAMFGHHTDRGSQDTSIRFTERLAEAGMQPSVGAVGSSYDKGLAS